MKRAYQVLGVPLSATSVSIKQAYRQLVIRWHPDRYRNGTEEYAEDVDDKNDQRMNAPLRYYGRWFSPDLCVGEADGPRWLVI